MSREGLDELRRQPSRDEVVERHRWPLIAVGAAGVGAANYVGLFFAGVDTRDALLIAIGTALLIVVFYGVLAALTRARVVPVASQAEPPVNEPEPLLVFPTRAEAAEEATRRDLALTEQGEFWKPEQLRDGRWGLRHRRTGKPGDSGRRQGWLERAFDVLGA